MDRRTHEAPMDFEYQNGTGPIDIRSPFAQVSGNHQRSFASSMAADNNAKKRGLRTAFGSPSKPSSPIKSFGASTPFSLKPNPLFATPRSMDIDMASSGGETPKSPEQSSILESDATPGQDSNTFRSVPVNFGVKSTLFGSSSPTKAKDKREEKVKDTGKRRDSWWSRAAGLVSSPGRGEVPRATHANDKLVKKVQKKRRGESVRQLMKLRSTSISDSEMSQSPSPTKPKKRSRWSIRAHSPEPASEPMERKGVLRSWAEFITAHPTLPQILSWWIQLTLNAVLVASGLWLAYSFYATIRSDVNKKTHEEVAEILAEMAVCARQYTENRCPPETRVPAMETVCTNWEKCMNRDTRNIGRAKISVGMLAEIYNGFIEPISWKAMIFTFLIIFGAVTISNLPFSMIRARADQAAAINHHYYGAVPPTPHRSISNPDQQFWTPAHRDQGLEPAPSQGYGHIDGRGSPVKQLQFR